MTEPIRLITIIEQADLAAWTAVETHEDQPNPHPEGSDAAIEWQRRYRIGLLRLSAASLDGAEASA